MISYRKILTALVDILLIGFGLLAIMNFYSDIASPYFVNNAIVILLVIRAAIYAVTETYDIYTKKHKK